MDVTATHIGFVIAAYAISFATLAVMLMVTLWRNRATRDDGDDDA